MEIRPGVAVCGPHLEAFNSKLSPRLVDRVAEVDYLHLSPVVAA